MTIKEAYALINQYAIGKKIGSQNYSYVHIENAAIAARKIATQCALDGDQAYIYALLHDIGRLITFTNNGELDICDAHRHPVNGYRLLKSLGYENEARFCITHAFVNKKNVYSDLYDEADNTLIESVLKTPYDDYDKLIQLVDELSTMDGLCPLESRFTRGFLEKGVNYNETERLNALLDIKQYFSKKCNTSIYNIVFDSVDSIAFL